MTSLRLIHIAPELPPTVGGIADYTTLLSKRLVAKSRGVVVPVLIRAGTYNESAPETEFHVIDIAGCKSSSQLEKSIWKSSQTTAGPNLLLLEYSGYGYAKRGAPYWLLKGLSAASQTGIPIVTMFHELYASGPPWTSAFWLSPIQRYIAARLAQVSQAVITNRFGSATWLRRHTRSEIPVHVQPVFSNVGEPDSVPDWGARSSYAVVFGGRNKKERLYKHLDKARVLQLQSLGVKLVIDIGPPGAAPDQIGDIAVQERGIATVDEIGSLFKQARAGLLSYPADYLTKSGIWSSYIAHGVLPLVLSEAKPTAVIQEDEHFIRLKENRKRIPRNEAARVANNARFWYEEQASSQVAARTFLQIIQSVAR